MSRFTEEQMMKLAKSGVHKIDLMGARGTTLVTMDECEAMACALIASGILVAPAEVKVEETINEESNDEHASD